MGRHTKRGGVKRHVQAHGWIDPAKTRMDQATSPLLAHLAEPKAEEVPKASREASKDVRGPDILNHPTCFSGHLLNRDVPEKMMISQWIYVTSPNFQTNPSAIFETSEYNNQQFPKI